MNEKDLPEIGDLLVRYRAADSINIPYLIIGRDKISYKLLNLLTEEIEGWYVSYVMNSGTWSNP